MRQVPPLSPPHSEVNTTLVSALEKNDRRNAPLLLVLVGVLTCGLAIYLSWTQGRRYERREKHKRKKLHERRYVTKSPFSGITSTVQQVAVPVALWQERAEV